jgi:DnaK suppressor protein
MNLSPMVQLLLNTLPYPGIAGRIYRYCIGRMIMTADEKLVRDMTLKKLLDEKKKDLLKRLYQDAIFEKLGREYKADFERGMDTADWSVVDSIQSLGLKLVDIRQDELIKMDLAQRKLHEGSYGICENCGEEIGERRLQAMIFAIHCLNCAQQNEKSR